jgi:hypothetical protein
VTAGVTKFRLATALVAALAVGALAAGSGSGTARDGRDALMLRGPSRPSVEAYFLHESYRPGETATLVIETPLRAVQVQILRTGDVAIRGIARDEMRGVAVSDVRQLDLAAGSPPGRRRVRLSIGDWPSGLYYAELRAAGGRVGYAPFVLPPRRLGEHRVAVVMPTNTWSAYNRRDADGDGIGDTWYADWHVRSVDLTRAFLDRGVPPKFRSYDLPFLRWLFMTKRQVDVLSQRELESGTGGERLARAYDLIVFPGHHEYVSAREYNAIERYRDLGGHLMFLSANNFFWRVVKHDDRMTRTRQWRVLGRPEAGLVGVQYIGNDRGARQGRYRVLESAAAEWLFADTGLEAGSTFGSFGVEIDHTARSSPPGTEVVAEIRNLFGPGKTAQMTYYETPAGAMVFAAGAFTMAGGALHPPIRGILENLWARLAGEPPATS